MLTAADLLHLPYTPDLTEGALAHAIRSLPHLRPGVDGSGAARLRSLAAGVSVELAFRRHLTGLQVPFAVQGAAPFTDPERYDVTLGGHRCNIKTFLLSRRPQITALRRDPVRLLKAPALVPSDLHASESRGPHDLYLFAFLEALVADSEAETKKAMKAGQPVRMWAAMPPFWMRPFQWNPLGPVTLMTDANDPRTFELSGQAADRSPLACRVELPPHSRLAVGGNFHSLISIHTDLPVRGRLAVHCAGSGKTFLIEPRQWENVWVYGMEIILAGYMPSSEFGEKAVQVPPGAAVFQYRQTRLKNLAVPVEALHPLGELFERTKDWRARRPA